MNNDIQQPSLFGVFPEFQQAYNNTVEKGKNFIHNQNIVITGLTRNSGDRLYNNIKVLDNFKKNISYFIYENDSTDNTTDILAQLSNENPKFKYKSEKLDLVQYGQVKDKERTERLADCRNTCLNFIKDNHTNTDYVIVLDLDYAGLSIDGLFHSFGIFSEHKKISAIAGFSYEIKANNILWNYDSWAFRWTWWDDLQSHHTFYHIDPMGWFGLYYPPIGSSPIFVNSAFGGCCIYKTSTFVQGKYSGEDCEHVTFHKRLYQTNNFSLVANPAQIMVF